MTTLTDPTDRAVDGIQTTGPDALEAQPSFAELGVDPAICDALEVQGILAPFAIQALSLIHI